MKHGSLFSGIGGFDLAAKWMNWDNVFHCEINTFGQKVLKYHFPESLSYENIFETDFTIHKGAIDVLSGGFPCQPYSLAGKRLGNKDERHLWPEMLRAIREIQPRWIVGENVFGLVNWENGVVFDEIQSDLEIEGYEVLSFILPAAGTNAPHRRDRIFIIAYSQSKGNRKQPRKNRTGENRLFVNYGKNENATYSDSFRICEYKTGTEGQHFRNWGDAQRNTFRNGSEGISSYTDKKRFLWEGKSAKLDGDRFSKYYSQNNRTKWENFPTQSPICGGDDGLSSRLDNITFSKWRIESIKSYGNAVVPQVIYNIFKSIELYENV